MQTLGIIGWYFAMAVFFLGVANLPVIVIVRRSPGVCVRISSGEASDDRLGHCNLT